MLNKVRTGTFLVLSSAFLFTACKKNNNDASADTITDAQVQSHNDDQNAIANQLDAMDTEASSAMETSASFSGRLDGTSGSQGIIACNATAVYDSTSNPKTITVTYNGANCLGTESRTGTIIYSLAQGTRWKDAGAVVTAQINNLKITRLRDNKSITINGTHTITNVSGGRLIELSSRNTPIVHTVTSSNMSVTFDDNTQRTWQVARQHSYSYNNGLVVTITGLHTDGTTTGITEWGTTRFATAFVSAITQPLVFRQDCNGRLVSGQIEHSRLSATATVTFGLDVNGNAVSCPSGAYYLKLLIARANKPNITVMIPY